MKTTVACLLLASACFLFTPSASATWKIVSTGATTGIGNPSCAEDAANLVVCAVQNGKNALMVNQFNGTSWGKWTNLAGTVNSDPSCTSDGDGHVFCAASSAGSLLVTEFNGTTWSKPTKVTGSLYSAPSCAEYLTGEVLCVARDAAGGLAWTLFNGTTWSAFATVSGTTISNPSCTTDNNSGVICAVFTTGYNTLVNRFAAGAWEGFLNVGGIGSGQPDCASLDSSGQVVCYVESYQSQIFGTRYNGKGWANSSWSTYGSIGGSVNNNAGCTVQAAGEQLCGAYGVGTDDDDFYVDIYNGSSWSGWTLEGSSAGAGVGSPSCAPYGGGEVVCAIMGLNNQVTSAVGP
jgi:hypothetical protein